MATAGDAILPPGTPIHKYIIGEMFGRGPFSITYRVREEKSNEVLALNEYWPASLVRRSDTNAATIINSGCETDYRRGREAFLREAAFLSRFKHPHIAYVRDFFELNNTAYSASEWVDGSSFEHWLKEAESPPSQMDLDNASRPLLSALELVHANETLHLHTSPESIIIRSRDRSPVLLGLGLGRGPTGKDLGAALHFAMGYSPPEQYASRLELLGPSSDIYSLGAVLFRAVTGRPPPEATVRHMSDDLEPTAKVALRPYRVGFLQAIDWSLKLLPRARPQSVAQWRGTLLPD